MNFLTIFCYIRLQINSDSFIDLSKSNKLINDINIINIDEFCLLETFWLFYIDLLTTDLSCGLKIKNNFLQKNLCLKSEKFAEFD